MKPEQRWERGLDQSYNQALESREAELLAREMIEDSILSDEDKLTEMAVLYFKTHLDECLPWAVDELMPAHTQAWEDDRERPTNAEYWNWNDDRI